MIRAGLRRRRADARQAPQSPPPSGPAGRDRFFPEMHAPRERQGTSALVVLEEYCRGVLRLRRAHQGEVDKMLRKPGEIGKYSR